MSLTPADLVVELVRTLEDARTDWNGGSGGDGVILMPSMYTEGSYQELEYRLGEMRDSEWHGQWWHLSMRYRWGDVRRMQVRSRKTRKGRVPELPPRTELRIVEGMSVDGLVWVHCYLWNSKVKPLLVSEGIQRLVVTMHDGDTSRLTLPREFLDRLLGERSRHDSGPTGTGDVQGHSLTEAQGSWGAQRGYAPAHAGLQ